MDELLDSRFETQYRTQRTAILKVYNYYRVGISFLFLFLFLNKNFNALVGSVNPDLFITTIVTYLIVNVLIIASSLFINSELLSRTAPSLAILTADILCLTLLMSASGGVASGIGNFMIFSLAFGGGLVYGRVSTALPAIAFILVIYTEFYLFFLDKNQITSFFQAGMLGIVFFVVNILFQTLSRQLRNREVEVYSLQQINQAVIEQMKTGVIVVHKEGNIKLINRSAEQLLQRPGMPTSLSRLPINLADSLSQWLQNPNKKGISFHTHDSGLELLASFSPLNNPEEDILIFLEDSFEAQRQAQQLKLAALGRLSASIAHEIRNPLGAISHAAQLLRESEALDQGDRRLSDIIQNHCIRMNNVIENVLQLSRRKTAEPKTLNINSWLRDFKEQFDASTGNESNLNLVIEDETLTIDADPLQLSQILTNLCQNGIRYSEKKTGEKTATIECAYESMGIPYLKVIDQGEGVDPDQVKNLFEPFFTTEVSGTGLGLYLSKELCEANDARLSYTQANSGGSSFKISFYRQTKK